MILCIAEKPSVARDIANILGATHREGTQGLGIWRATATQ